MTRPHRRIRIVWEPDADQPWIVQYDDHPRPHAWKDALRFAEYGRAATYLKDVRARDKLLLEAQR